GVRVLAGPGAPPRSASRPGAFSRPLASPSRAFPGAALALPSAGRERAGGLGAGSLRLASGRVDLGFLLLAFGGLGRAVLGQAGLRRGRVLSRCLLFRRGGPRPSVRPGGGRGGLPRSAFRRDGRLGRSGRWRPALSVLPGSGAGL